MPFDPKCRELAEHFLPSQASDRLKHDLAERIQDAVEEWLAGIAERGLKPGSCR